ncbi:hypothetical protein TNCT_202201 [Trichonephila clavata]|uniref:Uncharacterized protein n=1 Tax=Trichonephila clavata TaxID=2740835 RepID=A0A8X6L4T7_TRICU|nr:hypothetical protein TNCT_202201 [Trichonephila clavata]
MPQGSHMKARKATLKKPTITKPSKRGSCITKRTPKKQVADKKKLLKALERTMKEKTETELSARAGGSSFINKKKPALKAKNVRKGKKK